MNGYDLARAWYNFKFENPDKCRHIHSDLYFYIVDQWNRLGQKEKFGLPTTKTMESIGVGSYNTYKKAFNDLVEFKFIKVVRASRNQFQSKVIALSKNDKATTKALDKATDEAIDKALDTIVKQKNKETKEQKNKIEFSVFWDLYDYKKDKPKCEKKWDKLSFEVQEQILVHVPIYVVSTPDKKFRKHPSTYLNSESWNDEVQGQKEQPKQYVSRFQDENF